MEKITFILTLSACLSIGSAFTAFADWQQVGKDWKYETAGTYAADEFMEISGQIYHFSNTGVMDTGWKYIGENWFYFNTNGNMATGEKLVENNAYTFDSTGKMLYEGIHRNGLEDDLLTEAFVIAHKNWEESLYAMELVNRERAKLGITPLSLDFDLSVVATYRCLHMNKYNYYDHKFNNEYACDNNWQNYIGKTIILSENMHLYGHETNPNNGIINTETPREYTNKAHNELVNSPGHYRNMIDPLDVKVGIGFYCNAYRTRDYSVQLFSY